MPIHKFQWLLMTIAILCLTGMLGSCDNSAKNQKPNPRLAKIIAEAPNRITAKSATPAMVYLDSAVAQLPPLGKTDELLYLKFKSNLYLTYLNNYDSAIALANKIIKIIEAEDKTKYKSDYTVAYYLLGEAYYRKEEYKQAYDYYITASSMGEVSRDSCAKGEYTYRLAMILFRQTNYEDAANYFKQSFMFYGACKEDNTVFYAKQEILDNIGLSYACGGNNDSALKYYQMALDYLNDTAFINKIRPAVTQKNVLKGKAVVYGNMGQVYSQQKDYATAAKLFRESIAINGSGYDVNDAQTVRFKLADLYRDELKMDSMKAVLQDIEDAHVIYPPDLYHIELNRLQWTYYDYQRDTAKAYAYLREFTFSYEKYRVNDLKRKDENISQQLKIVAKQNDIDTLKQDNKANKIYLKVAIVFVALVLLFFGLIYNNWIKSRKNLAVQTRLTREVFKQKKQLEDFNNEKDRIMQIVAHDLRSPVSAIYMFIDLIKEEKNEDNKQEMLQLIKTASENALTLISEMLETPFTTQGKLITEPTDMTQLVKSSVELLRFRAFEKNQVINESIPPEPVILKVNKEKISRVISNLVINAIKFSPAHSAIEVKMSTTDDTVSIEVRDHGIGIPEKLKPTIFEMFTDARRPGTNGEKPFGLGLSICRQIVTAHGGKIWFESKQGEGSAFFVELKK